MIVRQMCLNYNESGILQFFLVCQLLVHRCYIYWLLGRKSANAYLEARYDSGKAEGV